MWLHQRTKTTTLLRVGTKLIDSVFEFVRALKSTFRHGFPHQPTAVAFDPVQRLLAIGTKSGSLRMYPLTVSLT
ncbi:syntaxin-binding protein 5 isoform X4 [Vespula squamosa]|uniref:Syntaxin-binding protein 5 isoform X4 n=1 Tax=Vespula squamosa TaxID=30214 RepID=A0ABD2BMP9_VESSQ